MFCRFLAFSIVWTLNGRDGSTTADMMSSPFALHCGCCADNDDGDDDKDLFHNVEYGDDENDEYGEDEDYGEGGDDDNNMVLVSTTMQFLCAAPGPENQVFHVLCQI